MARIILLFGAALWSMAGVAALGLAMAGIGTLSAALPPLEIDDEALGGAVTVVGMVLLGVGVVHAVIGVGLSNDWRAARSAGILLCAMLAVALLGSAAAAVASLVRTPDQAAALGCGRGRRRPRKSRLRRRAGGADARHAVRVGHLKQPRGLCYAPPPSLPRARGVVAQHASLSRWRSPVRIRSGPPSP